MLGVARKLQHTLLLTNSKNRAAWNWPKNAFGTRRMLISAATKTAPSSLALPAALVAASAFAYASLNNNDQNLAHAAPRRIQEVYDIIEKPIGQGAFGHVCTGVHRETQEVVAVKKIPKKHASLLKVLEEVDILREAGEMKSVPVFRDFFIGSDHYYIVMEMAAGGELFDHLVTKGLYTEAEAAAFLRDLAEVLCCLHRQGIVHADIKPENLMLADTECKKSLLLADFGSAFRLDSGPKKGKQHSGTVAYSAPEALAGEYVDEKADVWSMGVIMYIILSGAHPFDPMNDADDDQVRARILAGDFAFAHPAWERVSTSALELIAWMLEQDPKDRPTAQEVLRHRWFSEGAGANAEPLDASVESLKQFWRGRRQLKALLLACMVGLLDGVPAQWAGAGRDPDKQVVPGSRRTALRFMDQGQKGFLTAEDLARAMRRAGAALPPGGHELDAMLRCSDGDLRSMTSRVQYDSYMKLVPPICPAKEFKEGEAIFQKGDLDDTFYLIKSGEVDLRIVDVSKQRVFKTLGKGEYFGEVELLTPSSLVPRVFSAYCACKAGCEILAVPEEQFAVLRDPDLIPSLQLRLGAAAEEKVQALLRASIQALLPGAARDIKEGEEVWARGSSAAGHARSADRVILVEAGRCRVDYVPAAAAAGAAAGAGGGGLGRRRTGGKAKEGAHGAAAGANGAAESREVQAGESVHFVS